MGKMRGQKGVGHYDLHSSTVNAPAAPAPFYTQNMPIFAFLHKQVKDGSGYLCSFVKKKNNKNHHPKVAA